MTAPRPAGDGERRARVETDFDAKYRRCEEHNRARYYCGCYYADHPVAPWLATPSEPTVEAELAELADLRKRIARVRSMRDAATDGKVTVAALDWALDEPLPS